MPPLMASELPELARTRHHWIVLFRLPRPLAVVGFALLLVWAWVAPVMAVVPALLVVAVGWFRWQTWRAEQIILTRRRIIRVQGVPETTKTEAFLRVDRISGMRLIQTVPGKLLDYGTVELEAPGNHPDVRRMVKIWHPHDFYGVLRQLIFAQPTDTDPDDVGNHPPGPAPMSTFTTQPLPPVGP